MGAATESMDIVVGRIEQRAFGIKEVCLNGVKDSRRVFRRRGVDIPVEEEIELRKSVESKMDASKH